MIEEYVGYEGQERMKAVHEAPTPPRELSWPNPPRQALNSTQGNERFLQQLMDDVLVKFNTQPAPQAVEHGAVAALVPPALAPALDAADAWTEKSLHSADPHRLAGMVEKLYQQVGFSTRLQARQPDGTAVVLWLFSRHRPGMPASVVSCLHAPSRALALDDLEAVAQLVKAGGLARGQLVTTAHVTAETRQQALARRVHVLDTKGLLNLVAQRSAEQQRVLATHLN